MPEATLTRKGAEELIAQIRKDNSGLSREEEAGQSVRQQLGSATKTLAADLYSEDSRFLYELIRNAEYNQYTHAEANPDDPFISFSLFPDHLVIDSNEYSFTAEDVKAICSAGGSTRVGEKGIGFKSVFKVAQRVHIQSGPFSFSFQYTRGSDDEGLGMVTPLDEPYEDLPKKVRTRITLTLLSKLDFAARAEELRSIPDTLPLFSSKLRSVHVNVYPATGDAVKTVYTCSQDYSGGLEVTEKQSWSNHWAWALERRNFRVTRRTVKDLPYDTARQHTSQAEVVLAFPVSEGDNEVVLQDQHVFAYLPLRPVGFKFLIHSDFVTQATRGDLFHSLRNEALLSGVAETFRDAVLAFCEHDKLQYQWMRYLPDDSVSDEFWSGLRPKIDALLRKTPVLKSWSGRLCRPEQLSFVKADARDQYGAPLFADLPDEIYLHPSYTFDDYQLLRPLGTQCQSVPQFLDRLQADLERPDSKMKAATTEDDWHSRVAEKLLEHDAMRIKSLPLIPLVDRTWVAATGSVQSGPIYFPNWGPCKIPTDLGFHLVDPDAIRNSSRRKLFGKLGVICCDPESVISAIYRKHVFSKSLDTLDHLQFLFFNDLAHTALDRTFYILTEQGRPVDLSTERTYFPDSNNACDPRSVFQSLESSRVFYSANFIHSKYLTFGPSKPRSDGMTFRVWLEEFMGVKRIPQIHQSSNNQPSEELDYILNHRPEVLLGLLKKNWSHYAGVMSDPIEKRLKESEVPSQSGATIRLQDSYMPLPKLEALAAACGVFKASFFVCTPSNLQDEDEESWKFLNRFGVRFADDADFYLKLLDCIARGNEVNCSPETEKGIFRVYGRISRNCVTENDTSCVLNYLRQQKRIYLPSHQLRQARWVSFGHCVWDGPEWLAFKSRLSSIAEYRNLKHFFKTVLRMRDAVWSDSLDELSSMRSNAVQDHHKVSEIYRFLWRDFEKDSNHGVLRSEFEEDCLIFVPSRNAWFPPSSCLWVHDRMQIPGKVPISTPYASLQEFFNRMLEVQKPDLQIYTEALRQLSKENPPSILRIKESIGLISTMEPSTNDLKGLHSANIMPVKLPSGDVNLANASVDFAIVDRKEYAEAFKDKVITLDFQLNEVHACRPFLQALGLGRRFMSDAVEEKTMVQGGVLNLDLTNILREKAHAILRISVHFNGAKTRDGGKAVFDLLRSATVYVSEKISKSISLTQNLQVFTVERSRANFHLEECGDGPLKFYVPSDRRNRELCYLQQLPKRVLQFLCISDSSAEAVLVKVLGSSSRDIVDALLEDAGIIELDTPDSPQDGELRTGLDSFVQLPEGQGSQINSASPTSRNGASSSAENGASPRAGLYRETPRQDSEGSPQSSPSTAHSLGHAASVFGGLYEDASENHDAGSTADQGLGSGSSTTLADMGENSTSSAWFDSFLQISNDHGNFGTEGTPFRARVEYETATSVCSYFQSITFQQPYQGFSFEELRLRDYCSRLKATLRSSEAASSGDDKAYAELLERVINSARTTRFPHRNEVPVTNSEFRFMFPPAFGTWPLNRDSKINAAGELYAFEQLKSLSLPGFDTTNWQSTIRKEARVCDKYRNLAPWVGSETSALTYTDTTYSLTKKLVAMGYFPTVTEMATRRPTYYLDVKTTTGQWDEPFFISTAQHRRMVRMALEPDCTSSEIYVLLRVYNIENEGRGMKVYLDPYKAKVDGELAFTVNTWAVQPVVQFGRQD